ncbi:LamG domain-containing protein [Candidatus Zixiibacteriota bacterium]
MQPERNVFSPMIIRICAVALFLLGGTACEDTGAGPGDDEPGLGTAYVEMAIPAQLAGIIDSVGVTVTAGDITTITQALVIQDTLATATISEIPAGPDRVFTVDVFKSGIRSHTGADSTDIHADQSVNLQVSLTQLTGTVVVTITLPGDTQGYALSFDGVNDYAEVAQPVLNNISVGTIELWIKLTSFTGEKTFTYGGENDGMRELELRTNSSGTWFGYYPGGSTSTGVSGDSLSLNVWHHLAMQWDTNGLELYIDGESAGTDTTAPDMSNLSSRVRWSRWNNTVGTPMYREAMFDETRISSVQRYSSTFTPSRILTTDSNTIGLWHFDEGSGSVITDSSGNGNNGNLYGGPTWVTDIPPQ